MSSFLDSTPQKASSNLSARVEAGIGVRYGISELTGSYEITAAQKYISHSFNLKLNLKLEHILLFV